VNGSGQRLLLLYRPPTKNSGARVSLWRQLKKSGALPFTTSTSLLPDHADHYERFQWLAQQVSGAGGEATLIRVSDVEGVSHADLVRQFNEARARDYDLLAADVTKLIAANKRQAGETFRTDLEKLVRPLKKSGKWISSNVRGRRTRICCSSAHRNRTAGTPSIAEIVGQEVHRADLAHATASAD
jgi:hypothetical protein